MRWNAILVLLILLIFIGTLGFLFLDNILEWTIEKSLETVTGARAEINKLHLDIVNLQFTIGNLQIANPKNTWRNLIETN